MTTVSTARNVEPNIGRGREREGRKKGEREKGKRSRSRRRMCAPCFVESVLVDNARVA
jgi:hypothetical protein